MTNSIQRECRGLATDAPIPESIFGVDIISRIQPRVASYLFVHMRMDTTPQHSTSATTVLCALSSNSS